MLPNNNQNIINKFAKRVIKANKNRYTVLLFTITLASFMLCSVLTVGSNYVYLQSQQTIRNQGADYDLYLVNGFTEEQKQRIQKHDEVFSVGVGAYAGYVVKTDVDDTIHTGLLYYDEVYWNTQAKKAVQQVEGKYPEKSNEIMVTKEALEDCGKGSLGVHDSFTMTYETNNVQYEKEFVISGIWEGYGSKDIFYVSKSFYETSGYQLHNNGVLHIKLKNKYVLQNTIQDIQDTIQKNERQILFVNNDVGKALAMMFGVIGLAFIICLSAYLLIYNILYLSIAGNVRYYGLLQTLGMTKSQLRNLIQRQMGAIGICGIVIGTLLGVLLSTVFLPYVLTLLGIQKQNIELFFQPILVLISILIVAFTLYISVKSPVKIANNITPMEALLYRSSSYIKETHKKTKKGKLHWRMAREQLSRNRKKSLIVSLSLATSLSAFLCIFTIIDTQDERAGYQNFMDVDLTVRNDTAGNEDGHKIQQIFHDDTVKQIKEVKGLKDVNFLYGVQARMHEDDELMHLWLQKYVTLRGEQSYESMQEDRLQNPQMYYSLLKGIDEKEFEYVNTTLQKKIDTKAFMKGEICLIYGGGMSFKEDEVMGKQLQLEIVRTGALQGMEIAGIIEDGYYGASSNKGYNIITSKQYLDILNTESILLSMNITYMEEGDEKVENKLLNIFNTSEYNREFSYDSKLESRKKIKEAQGGMMEIGIVVALLLLLVGVLNYINTIASNIQNRKITLSIMESLGMSQKQVKYLLVSEGILYACGSIFITFSVGVGITYVLFQSMNPMQASFKLPMGCILIAVLLVMVICSCIPIITYNAMNKKESIIEKIKGFE